MIVSFFAVIHELAVLGTTFFLMALTTLWYSPLLFGEVWLRVSGIEKRVVFDETNTAFMRQLITTFCVYVSEVALLAWLLAYGARAGMTPALLTGILSVFVVVVTLPATIFEGRPWQYFAIHTGFLVVFIALAVLSLTYWPW